MAKKRKGKKSRSRRGFGSIYQKSDGTWMAAISYKTPEGQRKRVTKAARSEVEADQIRVELLAEFLSPEKKAFAGSLRELLDRYFRDNVHGRLKRTTVASYEYARDYLEDLEDQDILQLHPMDIADFLAELDCGPNTKQKVKNLLKRAYDYAVTVLRIAEYNPCIGLRTPSVEPEEVQIFSEKEIRAILKAMAGHRDEGIITLCSHLGLREGEAFGLRWMDVDFKRKEIRIIQNVTEVKGELAIDTPKTASSRRTIPINDGIIKVLNKRRKAALKEQMAEPGHLVFPAQTGGPISRTNFAKRVWKPTLSSLNIPHRRVHALRHTAATEMLRRGVPVTTVAGMLGHKNPSTLLEVYAHWIQSDLRVAADLMSGFGKPLKKKAAQPE